MTEIPLHVSEPLSPSPAPPPDDPNAPSSTVNAEGFMIPGGPQTGETLTTSQGVRLKDTDHSLKAGRRGPSLLEDHHHREKITHFDHERIPERVVHARGAAAHGVFQSYGTGQQYTKAGLLAEGAPDTPVFVRFSTVVGSRGSADTVRDTRGFAVKFYTEEGTWDLVGNNIPVFFIQDGIKFPDIVHAAKPHPDLEIPQAQSAHDTFWDFVSLHTEATHHTMWFMSDRGIPRSYRTMPGFGVHTFRLVAADDSTVLVKFHWKPVAGVHSMVWEEAQITAGVDPDFHRRDLAEAIASEKFPQWELCLQVMPDTPEETFDGIDLLDSTKFVPEEACALIPVGLLTLNRNPSNYFAETEQVAFHTAHLVPGIDGTNDPLLHSRHFSYLDTQLSRLGGPNFGQLPINRTRAEVNDNLRDAQHQTQVHTGVAPYSPNSLAGGCPFLADPASAYVEVPTPVSGERIRANPASFDDHFSQPAVFYRSMTPIEQQHTAEAYAFELAKCHLPEIRERTVAVLARVDTDLASAVASLLGIPVPDAEPVGEVVTSPALSLVDAPPSPVKGRVIGLITAASSLNGDLSALLNRAAAEGVTIRTVAPTGAPISIDGQSAAPERTYATTRSVEFDAVVVLGEEPMADDRIARLVEEAYRHLKPVVAGGPLDGDTVDKLFDQLGRHRVWERADLTAVQH